MCSHFQTGQFLNILAHGVQACCVPCGDIFSFSFFFVNGTSPAEKRRTEKDDRKRTGTKPSAAYRRIHHVIHPLTAPCVPSTLPSSCWRRTGQWTGSFICLWHCSIPVTAGAAVLTCKHFHMYFGCCSVPACGGIMLCVFLKRTRCVATYLRMAEGTHTVSSCLLQTTHPATICQTRTSVGIFLSGIS